MSDNLFKSSAARFAAHRIDAGARLPGSIPVSETGRVTRALVEWVGAARVAHIEERMKQLVVAMRTFPASHAIRIMAAVSDRAPLTIKRAFQEDAMVRRRISFVNSVIFIEDAFSKNRVQRFAETARRCIERHAIDHE